MNKFRNITLIIILAILGFIIYRQNTSPSAFQYQNPLENVDVESGKTQEEKVITVVETASPAVVTIIDKEFLDGEPLISRLDAGIGTGFLVSPGNLIFTANHVVSGEISQYVILTSEGREIQPESVARDPFNDFAIVKLPDQSAESESLPYLELGDSDILKVGQTVVAIGNAFGRFTNTVTTGVISGKGRGITARDMRENVENLDNVLQTDAALNPGNSGGPLLNLQGEAVAVASAVSEQGENLGFALPINTAKEALQSFKESGEIERPFLGVRYQLITPDIAAVSEETVGAEVLEVVEGSAAEEAGVRSGDIITAVDGEEVDVENALGALIRKRSIDQTVSLTILREGEELKLEAQLGKAPTE